MAFSGAFDRRLRPALNALDETSRMVGNINSGIQMYKIAVVGDQSSGKSSLIESMFGFSLPRGEGIVTRTPIQVEHRFTSGEEHAEISYRRDPDDVGLVRIKIDDLDQIEKEVRKATAVVAGDSKGVEDSPIYLRVHTSRLPDLTVVDLPGITCACWGCVVTKIDLTEQGQEMLERLTGGSNALKLKLGFIPVRNRTAKELSEGTPLAAVRANEAAFFEGHPQLRRLPKDRRGIGALVEELARVQMQCIRKSLPDVKKQVREKLDEARAELAALQGTVVANEAEALTRLQQLCIKLETRLLMLLQGVYHGLKEDQGELKVPRRMHEMAEDYRQEVEEACCLSWFLGGECFAALREQSKDARGVALPNFLHSGAFHSVYTSRVQDKLLAPALDLVARVRAYMEEQVLGELMGEVLRPFPRLLAAARDQGQELLRGQEARARAHVELMIRQQGAVMTLNHYYMDTVNRIRDAARELREAECSDAGIIAARFNNEHGEAMYGFIKAMSESQSNEDQALRDMQISLQAYSKVVLKRVVDNVALGARLLLVEEVGDELAGAIQEGLLRLAEAAAAQDGGSDEGEPFEELEGGASADSGSTEPPAAAAAGAAARSGALLELMQDAQQARRREELARVVGSLEKAWARLRNINVA